MTTFNQDPNKELAKIIFWTSTIIITLALIFITIFNY